MNTLKTKQYLQQNQEWPQAGKHIMAQYDDETITVYQAYRKEIGEFAAKNKYFGGEYSYNRMSWIKPNFLWMMYRSGWGKKEGQEITLAITIKKSFFEEIISQAVASSFTASDFSSAEKWKQAVSHSDVRLQWDPDHAPNGTSLQRRAIQLGLRGDILKRFGKDEIVDIQDISDFVAEQSQHITNLSQLVTPEEKPYFTTALQLD